MALSSSDTATLAHAASSSPCRQCVQACCCWLFQVNAVAAGRAAVQRRAPPVTEAAPLPGGSPLFTPIADDGNKVLVEAIPPLQVGCLPAHFPSCQGSGYQAGDQGSPQRAYKVAAEAAVPVTHGWNLDFAAAVCSLLILLRPLQLGKVRW